MHPARDRDNEKQQRQTPPGAPDGDAGRRPARYLRWKSGSAVSCGVEPKPVAGARLTGGGRARGGRQHERDGARAQRRGRAGGGPARAAQQARAVVGRGQRQSRGQPLAVRGPEPVGHFALQMTYTK